MEKSQVINYEIIYSKIKNLYIQIKDGKVLVKAPKQYSKKQIEKIVMQKQEWINNTLQKMYKQEKRKELYTDDEFVKIVNKNAQELIHLTGLIPKLIRIRDIKYAWGTCSKNKNITINKQLVKYDEQAIRYVILHELCHLKYMNHSKDFWNLVSTYMPNYKEIRKTFKEE